jgi:hypothetical protein
MQREQWLEMQIADLQRRIQPFMQPGKKLSPDDMNEIDEMT